MIGAQKFSICSMVLVIQMVSSISFGADGHYLYPDEREALFQLRDSLNSAIDLHSNWTGQPCYGDRSNWTGIACSNWHVVRISLNGIQLSGSLPPMFLQNLSFLSKLSLRHNSIFGSLPNFTNLENLKCILLSHNRFSGSIPSDLINLQRLAKLELQENTLTGNIPPFNQSTLTVFDVSYNLLKGSIPKTSVLQRFPISSFDHNLQLCGNPLNDSCPIVPAPGPVPLPPSPSPSSPSEEGDKHVELWVVILIAVAAATVATIALLTILCYRKRRVNTEQDEDQFSGFIELVEEKKQIIRSSRGHPGRTVELEFIDKERAVFDLDDLLRASAEQLGMGKLGTTYKATLEIGSVVTVKRLNDMNGLSYKEFVQQMRLLGKTKHENLVEIISFYDSKDEKLVVYEYVDHGSLFELLHGNRVGKTPVKWSTRLSIVRGVAEGLNFLHQSLPYHKVPHANLKSSNILLDLHHQKYHPKLTDYGFLPLLPPCKSCEMLAAGRTPEFSQAKKQSHKTDVYCFGIVVLEVITGRVPVTSSQGNDEMSDNLADWVREVVNDDWSTDILDMDLLASEEGQLEMFGLTEIALDCTAIEPENRPRMTEVLRRIQEIEEKSCKWRG